MTDQEFVVLDELYFVQSFNELIKETSIQQETLRDLLLNMIDKGWIRCLRSREDDDAYVADLNFKDNYQQYFYLASKEGLRAHNSR